MRHRTTRRKSLAVALASLMLTVAPAFAQPASRSPATIDYVVKPGDTLFGLAERYLVNPIDYRVVARMNRVTDPRRLGVGRSLKIPLPLLRTEPSAARIANFRGAVAVETGGAPVPAQVDRVLREGDVISTGANAFARLALADGSHVSLPSRSRVRIARLRTILLTGAVDHAFRLEAGRVEADVAPVRAPGGFSISTPIAVSAVRGTEFRNAYDPEAGRGSAEVIEGAVTVQAGAETLVAAAAQGVAVGGEGLQLTALLLAPVLRRPDAVQTDKEVAFDIEPMPGAARYRARLATDAGMVDAFAEAESALGEAKLVFTDVAEGAYFVRLSGVLPEGVEGLASVYSFIRARNGVGDLAAAARSGPDRPYLFRWETQGPGTAAFRFQLRRVEALDAPLVDQADLSRPEITVTGLPAGVYVWRVRSTRHAFGRVLETWSEPQQLRVGR